MPSPVARRTSRSRSSESRSASWVARSGNAGCGTRAGNRRPPKLRAKLRNRRRSWVNWFTRAFIAPVYTLRECRERVMVPSRRYIPIATASPCDHAAREYRALEAAHARLGARADQLAHRPHQRIEPVGRAAGREPVLREVAHL